MSKGNIVKVGDIEYEAEVLTASTEPGATKFAVNEFWDYVRNVGIGTRRNKNITLTPVNTGASALYLMGYIQKCLQFLPRIKTGFLNQPRHFMTLLQTARMILRRFIRQQSQLTLIMAAALEVPKEGEPNPLA
jgi:hypothetical protein